MATNFYFTLNSVAKFVTKAYIISSNFNGLGLLACSKS